MSIQVLVRSPDCRSMPLSQENVNTSSSVYVNLALTRRTPGVRLGASHVAAAIRDLVILSSDEKN